MPKISNEERRKAEKWRRYYIEKDKEVDRVKISKRWAQRGKEIYLRLKEKRDTLKDPSLNTEEKEQLRAGADFWCRQVYSEVARHIGCKASQFPPYQVVNGSDKVGIRVADLTYSFGTYQVHYTLGGLLERVVAMKIEKALRRERKRKRAVIRKERKSRKKEMKDDGEVVSSEEGEESSDDSDEDDSDEDLFDDEVATAPEEIDDNEFIFKSPLTFAPASVIAKMGERYFLYDRAIARCKALGGILEMEAMSLRPKDRQMTEEERIEEFNRFTKRQIRLEKAFDYMLNSQRFPPPVVVDHHLRIGFHVAESTYDFGTQRLHYVPNILAKMVGFSGILGVPKSNLTHAQPCPKTIRELDAATFIYPTIVNELLHAQKLVAVVPPQNPHTTAHVDSPTVPRKAITRI